MTEEAPSTSSSFLYPLLQTLDHEPPLSDENDNPADNPAQDKYRKLAHDMIRGLVDPGLKSDRKALAPREDSVKPELPSVDRGEGICVIVIVDQHIPRDNQQKYTEGQR